MNSNQRANQYRQTSILTAPRGQLLIMLYEAAIQNVKKASLCIDRKDTAGKGRHIGKTHDIVNELINTLDFKAGGQIARDLERLYNFMVDQLVKANAASDKEALSAVQKLLENLHGAWKGAVEQVQKGQAK